jgi:hypothetical protein
MVHTTRDCGTSQWSTGEHSACVTQLQASLRLARLWPLATCCTPSSFVRSSRWQIEGRSSIVYTVRVSQCVLVCGSGRAGCSASEQHHLDLLNDILTPAETSRLLPGWRLAGRGLGATLCSFATATHHKLRTAEPSCCTSCGDDTEGADLGYDVQAPCRRCGARVGCTSPRRR